MGTFGGCFYRGCIKLLVVSSPLMQILILVLLFLVYCHVDVGCVPLICKGQGVVFFWCWLVIGLCYFGFLYIMSWASFRLLGVLYLLG